MASCLKGSFWEGKLNVIIETLNLSSRVHVCVCVCFPKTSSLQSSEYWQNFKAKGVTSELVSLGNLLKSFHDSIPFLIDGFQFYFSFHYQISLHFINSDGLNRISFDEENIAAFLLVQFVLTRSLRLSSNR